MAGEETSHSDNILHEKLSRQREKILYEPRIAKLIIELSIPLFISGSLQSIYGIADTFWLSRLGNAALATPTVSWPFRGILMSIGFSVASTLSALTGQYIGAGDYRKANRSVGQVLGLLLAIGLLGSIGFYLSLNWYLAKVHTPSDIYPLARRYLEVIIWGTLFSYFFLTWNFAVGSAGDTKTPMKVSVATSLLNFALDPILIFPLGLGVFGAALATLIANIISGLYGLYSLVTGRHGIRVHLRDLVPRRFYYKLIAKIGGPTSIQRLLVTFGFIVMIRIVNGLGTAVVAAYSIGQVVLSIDHIIVFPLVRSTSIVIAQSLGAKLLERAKQAFITGLKILLSLITIYVVFLVLFRNQFISVFTSSPEVAEAASRMLLIFGPSVIGFDLTVLANAIARSSGHTLLVSIVGASRLWLLRIPFSYLLAYRLQLGDTGLWTGMALSNWVTGAILLAWLLTFKWLQPIIPETGKKGRHPTSSGDALVMS